MVVTANWAAAVAVAAVASVAQVAGAQTSMILPGPSGKAQVKFEIRVPEIGRAHV